MEHGRWLNCVEGFAGAASSCSIPDAQAVGHARPYLGGQMRLFLHILLVAELCQAGTLPGTHTVH